jgi:Fungal ubiquitin-associated domain
VQAPPRVKEMSAAEVASKEGLDRESVERYVAMGFDVRRVVEGMKRLGVRRVREGDGGEELLEVLLAG